MSKAPKPKATDGKLADLKQQISDLTDALRRERADTMNIRRRHDDHISGINNIVKANVIRELLPVIDNFDRALAHIPKDIATNDFVKGVQAIAKQFEKSLADMGVERIKTTGQIFDPRLHEAIAMEEGDGDIEIVSAELQAGYLLGDEIIRHAMVRVKMENKEVKR